VPGPQFFETRMGRTFYEATMPALVDQITRLNDNIEKIIEKQNPLTPDQEIRLMESLKKTAENMKGKKK